MSATARAAAPQPDPAGGRHRPTLRLVRSPQRVAPRLPFVAVVVALLSLGLVGLLLLSMQRGQASFRQGSLATTDASLADQVQALQREVEADQDPGVLAARAHALGMVPETDPGFLDSRGAVIGAVPSGDPRPSAGAMPVDGVVVAGRATVVAAPSLPVHAVASAAAPAAKPAAKSSGAASPTVRVSTPATARTAPSPTAPSPTHPAATPSRSAR